MLEAIVSITPPHSWIKRVTVNFPVIVRVIDCRSIPEKEGVQELFEIACAADSTEKVIDFLKHDDYVYDVDIAKGKSGRIIGSLKTKRCTACRTFAGASCYLVSASSKPDGKLEWTLLGSDTMVKNLLAELEKARVVADVLKVSQLQGQDELTARQDHILQIALEKGYFEFPKKISLRELAKSLQVSPATLSEILRRGQRRVLQEHFKGRPSVLVRQGRIFGL
jgi:predicted DNA binding protein